MKLRIRAKIAATLALSLILQGMPAALPREPQMTVTQVDEVDGKEEASGGGAREIVMPQPGSIGGVVTAYAADPSSTPTIEPTPVGTPFDDITFYFEFGGKLYRGDDTIDLRENTDRQRISIVGVMTDENGGEHWYTPADLNVTIADQYEERIIKLEEVPGNQWARIISFKGIGTSPIEAHITDGKDGSHRVTCNVRVPFNYRTPNTVEDINTPGDDKDGEHFGMLGGLIVGGAENDPKKRAVQLSIGSGELDHYLPMFQFVDYTFENETVPINSFTDKGDRASLIDAPQDQMPFLVDDTATDPNVATVDADGYIRAVGAGYTTVKFMPINGQASEAVELTILVAPRAKQQGTAGNLTKNPKILLQPGTTSFALDTNAKIASTFRWTLYKKNTVANNKLGENEKSKTDIDTDYMQIYISENNEGISVSGLKAGVYHLVGTYPQYKEYNTRVEFVDIEIVVPIGISEERLIMNAGDTYDILLNAQVLDKSIFQWDIYTDVTGSAITALAKKDGSLVRAIAKGDVYVILNYMGGENADKDIFGDKDSADKPYRYPGENGYYAYKDRYVIPITIIDDLYLDRTSATMSRGATLQLIGRASNLSIPLIWTSSDESILTVDEDGLVTAVKEGTATIRVTQTIEGVTKTAECVILVTNSVTKIVLDPASKEIGIGEILTINAQITPKIPNISLKWITSDEKVLSIEQPNDLSTTVKGLKEGVAVVTAINQENVVVGSCLVTVVGDHAIKRITLSQTNVTTSLAEKTFVLYATITPKDAENQPVVWSSSDTSIATVDQKGLVTLRKSGTVTIICTAKNDSSIAASCRVTITQNVTGIRLDQTALNMNVGETFRLTYVLAPANASNTAVTFTSTNSSIATVNNTGVISARGVGQTAIIVKTNDGGFMATCLVNVGRVATAVRLDATAIVLNVGDNYTFETTITPADSTDATLTWEVSDKSVAVVSNKGKVIAKKAGVSVIMAKTRSGSTAYCTVTVQQGVTGVKLDDHEGVIYIGDEWELNATVSPKSATTQDLKWVSSDRSVATVDKNGRIVGVKEGLTIITCTTVDGGYVDYCAVQVISPEVESQDIIVTPESCLIGVGEKMKLEAQVLPENTTDKSVEWTSSDPSIVTVDEKGRITGVSVGNAVVTCTAMDGSGAEAYCEVEVCQKITDIRLDNTYLDMVVGDTATVSGWIYPSDATYGVTWTSDDPTIAIVDQNGKVTALKAGDTNVRATAQDESGVESVCVVHVRNPVPITNITVSESEIVMVPGESRTVSFTILPAGYTDGYVWTSDNPVVASVNQTNGLITANALGTANISIFADSGRSASIKVYVVGLSKTSLSLQQYTSTIISLEVYGASQSDLDVRWYSDNERIAEVQNGRIIGKALGTTYVYAVVNGRRLQCRVTVEKIRR